MAAAHDPPEGAPTTEPSAGDPADLPSPDAPSPAHDAPPRARDAPPRAHDPRKEWLAAVLLMLLIATVFAAFVGFMRSSF